MLLCYFNTFLTCGCVIVYMCICVTVQLDNADEQAAQVRRELDGRLHCVEVMIRVSCLSDVMCVHLFICCL